MIHWFGPAPFSPASAATPQDPTPVGQPCAWCEEPFVDGDDGYTIPHLDGETITRRPYHVECHQRQILGSVGHQRGTCTCAGGHDGDPPELTMREAARAAVVEFGRRLHEDLGTVRGCD